MTRALLAAAIACAGCGGVPDPCAELAGTCVAVRATSDTVDAIDHLELDIVYGDRHATTTAQLEGGAVVSLPVSVAIGLDVPGDGELRVGVVAAGKRSGVVLGTGAGSATVAHGERAAIELRLAPPQDCVAGSMYCGGDKLAGDPDTLYQCNGGGVPLARGVCAFGCIIRPGDDDTCRGGGGTCVDGGFYCGGDKLDGDPQILYRCAGGAGVDGVECADGCVVNAGGDDACR